MTCQSGHFVFISAFLDLGKAESVFQRAYARTKEGRQFDNAVVVVGTLTFALLSLPRLDSTSGRLVSIQEFPEIGDVCQPTTLPDNSPLSAFTQPLVYAAGQENNPRTQITNRRPERIVRDLDPTYSHVAINLRRNEIFMQDHNTWSVHVFNRLDNTPPDAARTEPKRIISGPNSKILFNSSLYIDPKNAKFIPSRTTPETCSRSFRRFPVRKF